MDMEHRKIGSLTVSSVGLGCNNFGRSLDLGATKKVVHAAIDAGITFFDTADIYGKSASESFLGEILGPQRKNLIIATKFGKPMGLTMRGASPAYIRSAIEASLKRLRTDYIDLYQLHEPDPDTPIKETLETLNQLIQEGKIREIGCSNFNSELLHEAAHSNVSQGFASVQNEYSLLYREDEEDAIPACEELGLAFLPYYPLASGLLTGKYRLNKEIPANTRLATGWHADRFNDENLQKVEYLITFAENRGKTLIDLSISWLLSRSVVASVIAGATSATQVSVNAKAASWKFSQEELEEINEMSPI